MCTSSSESVDVKALQSVLEQYAFFSLGTLSAVSMLQTILLLRKIPIFADLSAEHLEVNANIAQEK